MICQFIRFFPSVRFELDYDNMWRTRFEEGRQTAAPEARVCIKQFLYVELIESFGLNICLVETAQNGSDFPDWTHKLFAGGSTATKC